MVERPLCMREVPGSIPGFSKNVFFFSFVFFFFFFSILAYKIFNVQLLSFFFNINKLRKESQGNWMPAQNNRPPLV